MISITLFKSLSCAPCAAQDAVLSRFEWEWDGPGDTLLINRVLATPEMAQAEGIDMVPTMRIYWDGEKKEELIGLHDFDQLSNVLYNMVAGTP